MTWFEVYIPAKDASAKNLTLTVEGQNWMDALRTGLGRIGEGPVSNIMCDIQQDNSIHVTDVNTQRVFRLQETSEPSGDPAARPPVAAAEPEAPAPAPDKIDKTLIAPTPPASAPTPAAQPAPAAQPPPAAAKPAPTPAPQPAAPPAAQAKATQPTPAPAQPKSAAPPPQREAQFKTGPVPRSEVSSAVKQTDPQIKPAEPLPAGHDPTDMIADVFDATQDLLMDAVPDPQKVAKTLLDLALDKCPADAGTFYLADINGSELAFAAVRGPKADALKKSDFKVPVGQGIIGFCAQEGVCLVIRDMQHDSRYFAGIADAIGYQPKNTLCASAEKEGQLFGAIQLINSKKSEGFDAAEMELVRYIGLTAADMLKRVAEAAS